MCVPHARASPSAPPHCVRARAYPGAFQLYDINKDGSITYDEMLQIVQSIYKMTGEMVKLPADEDTPQKVRRCRCAARPPLTRARGQRVDKIFKNMDKDNSQSLTYEEFVEGSKQDPTIVQVCANRTTPRADAHVCTPRHSRYTTTSYDTAMDVLCVALLARACTTV
jgi:hypothetical protein